MAARQQRMPSPWRTLKTVAWSFFGVRERSAWDEAMARVTPMHLVLAGLVAAFARVLGLIGLVNWVVA